ncbi:hypothetical protein SDC9_120016 [bioreactor metagenome]|uniref:Uncharacterized protein n=1 Tax=bioreactor metagenome TaxID=1076179 RepID=A0A645C5J9_9ZZZZ
MTGQGTGDIHPDIPVGGSPALGCFIEIVVQLGILEVCKPFLDGSFGLTADPEAFCLSCVVCELHDPAGHQLPFSSCIGGDDQALHIGSIQQRGDNGKLVLALLNHFLLELGRQHGKIREGPSSISVAVCSWFS